jgi:hypothetical protein
MPGSYVGHANQMQKWVLFEGNYHSEVLTMMYNMDTIFYPLMDFVHHDFKTQPTD